MCSVVGCYSGRRNAQRFRLPEDAERRLQWVQFLATVNKQRFKESSCADIAICMDHFREECFENYWDVMEKFPLKLKPSAVPTLCVESEERRSHLGGSLRCEVKTAEERRRDPAQQRDGSEEPGTTTEPLRGTEIPRRTSSSAHSPPHAGHAQPKHLSLDLMREKAERLQLKGTFVVNERRLLQLFQHACPACGCRLEMKKISCGLLVVLNQRCPRCDYRKQWKSQADARVPKEEELELTGVTEDVAGPHPDSRTEEGTSSGPGPAEPDQTEESEESTDEDEVDSDEDWRPMKSSLLAKELRQKANEEEEEDDTDDDDDDDDDDEDRHQENPSGLHRYGLCSECGWFFVKSRPHECEHKTKPFSCYICGKRFSTEIALSRHSRIHNANYEFHCKFCHGAFKTKADKFSHEKIHMTDGKPYKCPDCTESFASNKERRVHIEEHRGPPQLKCHICGIEFCWPLALKRHLAVHTGEKPYKCSVCERGFSQPSHLKSHTRLHTGERPFKCQHCDKRFNHNVSLKSHIQRYHTSDSSQANADAKDAGSTKGADSGEEEQDTEEEVQTEGVSKAKYKRKSTGRPKGRPKTEEPNAKKRQRSNAEENEDEQSDSHVLWDPAEKKGKSGGKAKKFQSKMRSSQNNGQRLKKQRGRPRKNAQVCVKN